MKFYSRGDESGCIPIKTLGGIYSDYETNRTIWLIEVRNDGSINIGHGNGIFG